MLLWLLLLSQISTTVTIFSGCFRTYPGDNITASGPDPRYSNMFPAWRLQTINRQATCPSAGKNAKPLGPCFASPEDAKSYFALMPEGQRVITLEGDTMYYIQSKENRHIWLDTIEGGYYGPWADEWKQVMKYRFGTWFKKFHDIGGKVDMIVADFEVPDDLAVWRITSQKPHREHQHREHHHLEHRHKHERRLSSSAKEIAHAIMKDKRWPTLQKELNTVGKQYNANFSDISDMAGWPAHPTDYRTWVWGLVLVDHHSAAWLNESVFQPIQQYFPNVTMSNFFHSYHGNPQIIKNWWPWRFGHSETPPVGWGAHVGTHQSRSAYGAVNTTKVLYSAWPGVGHIQSAEGGPFNTFVQNIRTFQVMHLAAPSVPAFAWLEPKQTTWSGSYPWLANDNMWQENVLHLGVLTATQQFLWWKYSHDNPIDLGWKLQNDLMLEMDALVKTEHGCAKLSPLVEDGGVAPTTIVDWNVPYVLSGAELLGSSKYQKIFRVTFRGAEVHPHTDHPAVFKLFGGETIEPVKGGSLWKPKEPTKAPRGYWIVL